MRTNILGIYDDEDVVLKAVDKLQDNGVKVADVMSPFPIHGIFEKLNLKTRMPLATFLYGTFGVIVVFAFLYWTSVVSYPLKFGGKPLNTLSFIIIIFVLTIFIGTLFTFLTYFIREKMYPGKEVTLPVPESTNDKFVIVVSKTEEMTDMDVKNINKLMKESGAVEIKESDVNYNS
ncbi:MAG: hypothetical protein C0595_06830 [Marinilabiliales bacterium]|nr:MAG: hypothetical protein C0595_06830 [Marinilabiliales bacterium]